MIGCSPTEYKVGDLGEGAASLQPELSPCTLYLGGDVGPDSVHLLHGVGGLRQAAEVLSGVYVSVCCICMCKATVGATPGRSRSCGALLPVACLAVVLLPQQPATGPSPSSPPRRSWAGLRMPSRAWQRGGTGTSSSKCSPATQVRCCCMLHLFFMFALHVRWLLLATP